MLVQSIATFVLDFVPFQAAEITGEVSTFLLPYERVAAEMVEAGAESGYGLDIGVYVHIPAPHWYSWPHLTLSVWLVIEYPKDAPCKGKNC